MAHVSPTSPVKGPFSPSTWFVTCNTSHLLSLMCTLSPRIGGLVKILGSSFASTQIYLGLYWGFPDSENFQIGALRDTREMQV